jgi:adenosylcobinamide-phosphate synthase
MDLAFTLPLALAALSLEAVAGYPHSLFARIGHPVTWIGAVIGWFDRTLNREADSPSRRRSMGIIALVLVLGGAALVAGVLQGLAGETWAGFGLLALAAASLPAQQSLYTHVRAVADGLEREGLAGGRAAVALIVGRDVDALDEAGVCRAAIESLAENFSDGVVAPAFWIALAGLPGGAIYKAANTADSMIGHRSARHADFGWAAARFDDAVNLPASRLSALWLWLAALILPGASAGAAWRAVARDASRHRSPNAGWPEAAMAGALGLKLAGPRLYGGVLVEDGFMGDGRAQARPGDIRRALRLYRWACAVQGLILAAAWLMVIALGSFR